MEGAIVIAVARREEALKDLQKTFTAQVEIVPGDITKDEVVTGLRAQIKGRQLHGILINAGGPPAKTVLETTMEDWDMAYHTVLRWKVNLVKQILPAMLEMTYGRILFVESAAVKEPIENLVLSNSIRLAAIGFMKTLSQEVAASGITVNALAPGSHNTPAIERLVKKKMEQTGMPEEEARKQYVQATKVGFLGSAEDFASLACWLLSPGSRYVTGQTISVAGGALKGTMG
jgi:3-oxoacyl-[acyl-carrier protein] reductase